MPFVNTCEASLQLMGLFESIDRDFRSAFFMALRGTKIFSEKEEIARVSLLVLKEKWVEFKDQRMRAEMAP